MSFALRNKLPIRLQEQMLSHLSLKFRTDAEGLQQQETLDALPKAIRSSISHHLFFELVQRVYLFQGVSANLLFQLVSEMRAEYFAPREDVILQDEAPTDFYILVTGHVELIHRDGQQETLIKSAGNGDMVGEIGVLCYKPQLLTVRTRTLSQLLRLSRASFLNLIQSNVAEGKKISENLLKHLKEVDIKIAALIEPVLIEMEEETKRQQDLDLTVTYAVNRDDVALLRHLLSNGHDPNECDKNKRTPLHIAASKGNEQCVRLLLQFGADPDCRDADGKVPLGEAIIGSHESIAQLLFNCGASFSAEESALYTSIAIEKENSKALLENIIKYGGEVTGKNESGETALHRAVCDGNIELVEFLLDNGCDMDISNKDGWTPRDLADQQCHEEIKSLFEARKKQRAMPKKDVANSGGLINRYQSEPAIRKVPMEDNSSRTISSRKSDFSNSVFGVLSSFHMNGRPKVTLSLDDQRVGRRRARVTISCPHKGNSGSKLVFLPESIDELLKLGQIKFEFVPNKVLMKNGAEIDDIMLIRDGDHLVLVGSDE